MSDDDLRDLFRTPPEGGFHVDLDELGRRARSFERTIRRRNLIEVFACGLLVAIFGALALTRGFDLEGVGLGLGAFGALVVAAVLLWRGEGPRAGTAQDTARFLTGYRDELLYQARLLRRVPIWYLGPLVPGAAVLVVARLRDGATAPALTTAALVGIVFVGIAWLNLVAARQLERQAADVPTIQD